MYLIIKIKKKKIILNRKKNLLIDNLSIKIGNLLLINDIIFISNKKFSIISKIIIKKIFAICLIKNMLKSIKIIKLMFKKRNRYKKKKNIKPIYLSINLIYLNLSFLKIKNE